jgi:hypothetical protein
MAVCTDPVLRTSTGQYALSFQIKVISQDACHSVGLADLQGDVYLLPIYECRMKDSISTGLRPSIFQMQIWMHGSEQERAAGDFHRTGESSLASTCLRKVNMDCMYQDDNGKCLSEAVAMYCSSVR